MKEGVTVHFLSHGVMNDVATINAVVVGSKPGIDPKTLDSHNLFLFITHRSRYVHHINNYCVGFWPYLSFKTTKAHVFFDRNDHGPLVIVNAHGDLSSQRVFI